MGKQTQGITSKPSESSCEDARVAALRCSTKYPNERIVCKELYETYKECRKKEQEEIVKERKRNKVSIL
ncbi:unnamed protein product [Bathycoccus prasinos]